MNHFIGAVYHVLVDDVGFESRISLRSTGQAHDRLVVAPGFEPGTSSV